MSARDGMLIRATLPARYGEAIFWLARYMERIENLARMLDVTESFARDDHGVGNWRLVAQINGDEVRFRARYEQATGADALRFYMLDGDNPTSIRFAMRAAYQNARTLRPLISTEMWSHMNVFNKEIEAIGATDIAASRLSALCGRIKDGCHTHAGLIEATLYRDQGWYFYQLGKYLERADQTTRLLDIRYHALARLAADEGSPIDVHQWHAVLRAASGYEAFRRVNPRGMSPTLVASFLMQNDRFPRSLACTMRRMDDAFHQLRGTFGLRGGSHAMERLDELRAALGQPIGTIIAHGLHEFLDWTQILLGEITEDLQADFFGERSAPRTETPALTQAQEA